MFSNIKKREKAVNPDINVNLNPFNQLLPKSVEILVANKMDLSINPEFHFQFSSL